MEVPDKIKHNLVIYQDWLLFHNWFSKIVSQKEKQGIKQIFSEEERINFSDYDDYHVFKVFPKTLESKLYMLPYYHFKWCELYIDGSYSATLQRYIYQKVYPLSIYPATANNHVHIF